MDIIIGSLCFFVFYFLLNFTMYFIFIRKKQRGKKMTIFELFKPFFLIFLCLLLCCVLACSTLYLILGILEIFDKHNKKEQFYVTFIFSSS